MADPKSERLLGITRDLLAEFEEDTDTLVLAGPWLGEVAFELLYWLPFLQWVVAEYPRLRERLVVVSRGGAGPWYQDLSGHYVDMFERLGLDGFRARFPKFVKQTGRFKDYERRGYPEAERELVELIRGDLGAERLNVLHPSEMYRAFKFLGRTDEHWVERCYRRLRRPTIDGLAALLPARYVAARFYDNHSLPGTDANVAWARAVIEHLARQVPVVLLDTGQQFDRKHTDFPLDTIDNVRTVHDLMTAPNNLAVQSAVVGGALAFCGNYGGLSFLPPYYGCPAFAVFSDPAAAKIEHRRTTPVVLGRPHLGGYWAGPTDGLSPTAFADRVLGQSGGLTTTGRGSL